MYPDSVAFAQAHVQDRICVLCDHTEPVHGKRERNNVRESLREVWKAVRSIVL